MKPNRVRERADYKRQARAEFQERQHLIELAKLVRDQAHLESILRDTHSRLLRREVYELLKPHLTFQSTYEGEIASLHIPDHRVCTWNDPINGHCKSPAGFEKTNAEGSVWADLCLAHNTKFERIQASGTPRAKRVSSLAAHSGQPLGSETLV